MVPLSEPRCRERILVITHLSLVLNLVKPKVGLRDGYRVPNEHSPTLYHVIHHHGTARSIGIYQAKGTARLRRGWGGSKVGKREEQKSGLKIPLKQVLPSLLK